MDNHYDLVRKIMLSTNKIDGVYYLFAKKLGVNENTLAFLYSLADGAPHSQKEISDVWLIPKTTINSIVKTMLKEGLITFCAEPHKKEKALMLTKSGQSYTDQLLSDIYTVEEAAIIKTLNSYPPEFVSALEAFSNQLYSEFEAICQNIKERQKHE